MQNVLIVLIDIGCIAMILLAIKAAAHVVNEDGNFLRALSHTFVAASVTCALWALYQIMVGDTAKLVTASCFTICLLVGSIYLSHLAHQDDMIE